MHGAQLASPIRGEPGYAHRPQLGSEIHCPAGHKIWGPLGKEDVCPNFALTVGKFVFSNLGNCRAKAKIFCQSPDLTLNAHSGNDCIGPNSSADWVGLHVYRERILVIDGRRRVEHNTHSLGKEVEIGQIQNSVLS